MKKLMTMITLAAIAAAMTGCKSIEVDRRGQALATDANGAVVKTAAGEPLVLDMGWSVDYFQHWNWQEFDALSAKAGQAELAINNYRGGADATNLTAARRRPPCCRARRRCTSTSLARAATPRRRP